MNNNDAQCKGLLCHDESGSNKSLNGKLSRLNPFTECIVCIFVYIRIIYIYIHICMVLNGIHGLLSIVSIAFGSFVSG